MTPAPEEQPVAPAENPTAGSFDERWQASFNPGIKPGRYINYLAEERALGRPLVEKLFEKRTLLASTWNDIPVILIPYRSTENRIVAIQAVSITGQPLTKDGATKCFFKGSVVGANGFFCFGTPLALTNLILFVEAPIDALSAYVALDRSSKPITCIALGGSVFTGKLKKLKPFIENVKDLCAFFDNDDAGDKATVETILALGRPINVVNWDEDAEKGMDINQLLKEGRAQQIIDMVENAVLTMPEDAKTDLPNVISRLNKKHAVIMIGGKCAIINETIDPVLNRPDISFSSKNDFLNAYEHKKVPAPLNHTKQVSIGKLWWEHPYRRQYEGLVFEPLKEIPGYYNLWRGFSVEPRKGDWSLLQQLILDAIANGNASRYRYILAWMARIAKDPGGLRPGVAIVMRGRQGIGKGFFASNFGALLGSHFLQVAQAGQVTGRFNAHFKDCVLLFVDEGFWAGDKQAEGVIKNLITEAAITIEPKGKDLFQVKNNVNVLIASNSDWVVPAGLDERRFFTVDVSDCFKGDYDFFKKLAAQMDNGGREAMLYDLQNMDISGVNLRDFERTDALFDQIVESMTPVQKWWFTQLRRGAIEYNDNSDYETHRDEWPTVIPNNQLYKNFELFVEKMRVFLPHEAIFGKQLNKLIKPEFVRVLFTDNGPRLRARVIPPLDDCRKAFENLISMPVDWDDERYQIEDAA